MNLKPWLLLTAFASSLAVGQTTATRVTDFLNSIGVNSALDRRGETVQHTIDCAKFLGIRWFRSGPEGDPALDDLIAIHRETGARFSWGFLSGGSNLAKLIETGRHLAAAGALLAFEGPNEPNNWGITYEAQAGGRNLSWLPVANLQKDLYATVKQDKVLKKVPVWGISEDGAETDNVGLQFLKVPPGAHVLLPDGTRFSDYANVHNYIFHPNSPAVEDNKTWNAADPTAGCKVDGLFGEYGVTWAHHYAGYSADDLLKLPRVTTETGCAIDGPVSEEIHAKNLLTLYLDQWKRGWSYTAVYLLRDRVDEAGNQQFGFFKPDYTPRKAALYLHNLTTLLSDSGDLKRTGHLSYSIPNEPSTMHDLLLQKSNGRFDLVIWSELVTGSSSVKVVFDEGLTWAKVYDPTVGVGEIQSFEKVKSIPFNLTDHPLIIELRTDRSAR